MPQKKEQSLHYTLYGNESEIPADELELLRSAIAARESAYAAYSHFLVGAALRLEDGQIVTGNNQENAASPSSLCAERVAVYHAGAVHPDKKMMKLAIAGGMRGHKNDQPVAPCGACRQVILEYAKKQNSPIAILFAGTETAPAIKVENIADLLPFHFGKDFLG